MKYSNPSFWATATAAAASAAVAEAAAEAVAEAAATAVEVGDRIGELLFVLRRDTCPVCEGRAIRSLSSIFRGSVGRSVCRSVSRSVGRSLRRDVYTAAAGLTAAEENF